MDIHYIMFYGFIAFSASMVALGVYMKSRTDNSKYTSLLLFSSAGIWMLLILSVDNIIMGYGSSGTIETQTITSPISIFEDNYDTNTGWTQENTMVTVDSATADKMHIATSNANSLSQRVYKQLNTTVLASDTFTANFDFIYGSGNGGQHFIFALTAGNGAPATTTQDMLGVSYRLSTNTGLNIIYKDDGGSYTECELPNNVNNAGATYYVTLRRLTLTTMQLDVYTDSARTLLLSGYPHVCNIPATIGSFSYIQHGRQAQNSGMNADIDNMVIYGVQTQQQVVTSGSANEPIKQEFTLELKLFFLLIASLVSLIAASSVNISSGGGFRPFDKLD